MDNISPISTDTLSDFRAHLSTCSVFGITYRESVIDGLLTEYDFLRFNEMAKEIEDLSSVLEVGFYNALKNSPQKIPPRILNFLLNKPVLLRPKIIIETFAETRKLEDYFIRDLDLYVLDNKSYVMRFLFPPQIESRWRDQNSSKAYHRHRVLYEWGYFYRFLRDEVFWPYVNTKLDFFKLRLNRRHVHIPREFNYIFLLSPSPRKNVD